MKDARNILIAKVEAGGLSPAEAEAEAERQGLSRLQTRPDPAGFNPDLEPFWTLPMAVSWIAYRTVDAVREWWPEYRERCTHFLYRDEWRSGGSSGFRLMPYASATLQTLRLSERLDDRSDRDVQYSMTVDDALLALVSGLKGSCFEATGLAIVAGNRETIPDLAWQELEISESLNDTVRPRLGGGPGYRDVLIPMRAVRGLWQPRPPVPEPLSLPPLVPPVGGGYMPLYCAAQWIATHGGAANFDPRETDRWREAYRQLLSRVASEEVKVVGLRGGRREPVPAYLFAGIKIAYPSGHWSLDLLLTDEMYLQSYAYTDEKQWLEGFDDSLEQHRREKWSRLVVLCADVASLWPFALNESAGDDGGGEYRSGAPGRPTPMHLVRGEFDRRCSLESVEATITQEATFLSGWLNATHPKAPPLAPKAIANALRAKHRVYKHARK